MHSPSPSLSLPDYSGESRVPLSHSRPGQRETNESRSARQCPAKRVYTGHTYIHTHSSPQRRKLEITRIAANRVAQSSTPGLYYTPASRRRNQASIYARGIRSRLVCADEEKLRKRARGRPSSLATARAKKGGENEKRDKGSLIAGGGYNAFVMGGASRGNNVARSREPMGFDNNEGIVDFSSPRRPQGYIGVGDFIGAGGIVRAPCGGVTLFYDEALNAQQQQRERERELFLLFFFLSAVELGRPVLRHFFRSFDISSFFRSRLWDSL